MQQSIQYIRSVLAGKYPLPEVEGFIGLMFDCLRGFSRTDLLLMGNLELENGERELIRTWVGRLQAYEPIQYVLGYAHFYGLKFKVNPSVLIPRGETEELVQLVIAKHANVHAKVLDLGTGSGCIAISLKLNMKEASVFACDISEEALVVAVQNAESNMADVQFFQCNVLQSNSIPDSFGLFDVMVSNPPYITNSEKALMEANVLDHEPHLALFVDDNDPLLFYRAIAIHAQRHLQAGGMLYFEINEAFGDETVQMLQHLEFDQVLLHCDLHGKPRMIEACKPI